MRRKPKAGGGHAKLTTPPNLSSRTWELEQQSEARRRAARLREVLKALRPFAVGKAKAAAWLRIKTRGLPRATFATFLPMGRTELKRIWLAYGCAGMAIPIVNDHTLWIPQRKGESTWMRLITIYRLGHPANSREEGMRQKIVADIAKYGPKMGPRTQSPEAARIKRAVVDLIRNRFFMFPDLGSPAERESILAPGGETPASRGSGGPQSSHKRLAELERYGLTRDYTARMKPEEIRSSVANEKWLDIQTELSVFSRLSFWLHWCQSGKHWYFADYHHQSICLMDRGLRTRTEKTSRAVADYLREQRELTRKSRP
jgi:hypothetical protein